MIKNIIWLNPVKQDIEHPNLDEEEQDFWDLKNKGILDGYEWLSDKNDECVNNTPEGGGE